MAGQVAASQQAVSGSPQAIAERIDKEMQEREARRKTVEIYEKDALDQARAEAFARTNATSIAKTNDLTQARDARDTAHLAYTQAGQRQAPIINAANTGAAHVVMPDQSQGAIIGTPSLAQAAQLQGPANVIAPTLGQAVQAQGAGMGGTVINHSTSDEMRARELGGIGALQQAAMGSAPSAAEIMLRRQSQQNIHQQMGLAAAARGASYGRAQRAAAGNIAQLNTQLGDQMAQVRAQEQAQARGQLQGALQAARGADIGLETTQAGFHQQAGQTNAQLAQQVNLTNAGAQNQQNQLGAQMGLQAALANQQTGMQGITANAGFQQQANLSNAAAQNQASQAQAQLGQQNNQFNSGQALQGALANAGYGQQTNITNAGFQQQAAMQNAANQINQMQLDDNQKQQLMNAWLQSNGQMLNYQTQQQQIEANKPKSPSLFGTALGVGGMIAGGLLTGGNPAGIAAGGAVAGSVGERVE